MERQEQEKIRRKEEEDWMDEEEGAGLLAEQQECFMTHEVEEHESHLQ